MITDIIWQNKELINDFLPTLNKLIEDYPCVRVITTSAIGAIYNQNKPLAFKMFEKIINKEDLSLNSRYTKRFICQTVLDNYDYYDSLLNRFINSDIPKVRYFIAHIYSFYSFSEKEAKNITEDLIKSADTEHRKGAARTFSHFLLEKGYENQKHYILEKLAILLNDENKEVRSEAANFPVDSELTLLSIDDFIDIFVSSKAFMENIDHICYKLEKINIPPDYFDNILKICKTYIKNFELFKDSETDKYYVGTIIFKILLEIYKQSKKTELLDLIDEFLKIPNREYKDAFEDIDRKL